MGYDAGFDLYPPLKNTESDNELYASFHIAVYEMFWRDNVMDTNERGEIVFLVGEHPRLPKEGYKFRRFSSKISGKHHSSGVQHYLNEIAAIARTYFGDSRVHWWNESHERHGPYSWTEVYAAERSNPPADHRMYF